MRRKVAITGLGMVTPVGLSAESTWAALRAGTSGVRALTEFSTEKLRTDVVASVEGLVKTQHLSNKEAEIYGRVVPFVLSACVEAMVQAGLDFPKAEDGQPAAEFPLGRDRVGCLMSTGQGAVDIFEEQILKSHEKGPRVVSPFFIPSVMLNIVSAIVSMRYGLMGPSYNIASACATGSHSIATGALLIEAGEADVMIVGGSEAATRVNTIAGFGNARALGRSIEGDPAKTSRPFDQKRNGFVMGEGAGALVLEGEDSAKARGATILSYVAGFGMSSDGDHLTRPHPEGLGLQLAIKNALRRANIGPTDVGYINPHATSTPQGDKAEYAALKAVFGDALGTIPMSATKSLLGHLLGGAGGVEGAVTVMSLRDQIAHPSINADELDADMALNLLRSETQLDARFALKVSAGFGGHNCALVFERP